MNPNAIAKALAAQQKVKEAEALKSTPSTYSPSQPYSIWSPGQMPTLLPRDNFLNGGFGPGTPPPISPIDFLNSDGRPSPRRWEYPILWNRVNTTPGSEGTKLAVFSQIKMMIKDAPLLRACIKLRVEEALAARHSIGPTDSAEKAMAAEDKEAQVKFVEAIVTKGMKVTRAEAKVVKGSKRVDFEKRLAEVESFFARPDRQYRSFNMWLKTILLGLFEIDAHAINVMHSLKPGLGIVGTDVVELRSIEGSTFKPLINILGDTPRPPEPAYQQYLWGMSRSEFMTIPLSVGNDESEYDKGPELTTDELIYLKMNPRQGESVYGLSPVEMCLIPIITYTKRMLSGLQFYTEGSVPAVYIPAAQEMDANQAELLELKLNAIEGDQGYKRKVQVIPYGSKPIPMQDTNLASEFDQNLQEIICACFDVMPYELGIDQKGSSIKGDSGAAGQAKSDVQKRKGLETVLAFLRDELFNPLLQDVLGQNDMQWIWPDLNEEADALEQMNILTGYQKLGDLSADEVRSELGRDPWGAPGTSDPQIITATGAVPIGTIDPEKEDERLPGAPIDVDAENTPPDAPLGGMPTAPTGSTPLHDAHNSPETDDHPEVGNKVAQIDTLASLQLKELEILRRWAKKGRKIRDFKPKYVGIELIEHLSQVQEDLNTE